MYTLRIILIFTILICGASEGLADVYPYTRGNQIELLENPEDSAQEKIEFIRDAKHHIHIITFFWDDTDFALTMADELIKAHKRGVEVRILTSHLPSFLTDLDGNSRHKLIEYSQNKPRFTFVALKNFGPLITTNNLHEKIFLIDAELAILGGRNISDSQFNGKDMEVVLRGEVVNQVQDHFLKMLSFVIDLYVQKDCQKPQHKKCLRIIERFSAAHFEKTSSLYFPHQPFYESDIEARVLTHNVLMEQWEHDYKEHEERVEIHDDIIETIANTPFNKIRGYNYFMMPTPRYKEFLIESLKNGKQIELVTNSKTSAAAVSSKGYVHSLNSMIELAEHGLQIIEWKGKAPYVYMHTKMMIFDDERVIIGSHNFGAGSTSVSNEIAVEFKSRPLAARLIEIFESDKADSELTQKATLAYLRDNLKSDLFTSFILGLSPIRKTIREFY